MRRLALLTTLALLTACTSRARVLVTRDGGVDSGEEPVHDCIEALRLGLLGQRCDFVEPCRVPRGPCCVDAAMCVDGRVVRPPLECAPDCVECEGDHACPPPRLCEENRCVPCPTISPTACPPCPPTFVPLFRNECATCECLPETECRIPDGCAGDELCYPGLVCDPECATRGEECCANVCSVPGCVPRAPLGCQMRCPPEMDCGVCLAAHCECVDNDWECRPVCAPDLARPPPCVI